MGVAFAFSMFLETEATRQFVSTGQARYFAEAGVSHARAMLDEDRLGSRADDLSEAWTKDTIGDDADVDGDGHTESRWWVVEDAERHVVGRYAMQLIDEGGKANVNAALAAPDPFGLGALNLTALLTSGGIGRAQEVAEAIERYRYGADEKPGIAGIDDDRDGAIDEVDEYQPLALRADDRRFEALEDLVAVAGLSRDDVRRLSPWLTTYSWDLNVSAAGKARVNVNTATAEELLIMLLEAGVDDPWQAAANMADYADPDVEMSRVSKSAQSLLLDDQGPMGGWTWRDEPVGHYGSDGPGGAQLSWSVSVPTGTFRLLAEGVEGITVGDVTVNGQLHASVDDGESLGELTLGETLTIEVTNREAQGVPCAFRGVQLVSEEDEAGGEVVRGIEAIRFNELMVEPTMTLTVANATFDAQGSDWACPINSDVCTSSGVGQGRWSWTDAVLQTGRYHVRVFSSDAMQSGQVVGDVRIDSETEHLVDGQYHPSTVSVGADGKITFTIGKTDAEETYYFKGVKLSLQPDAEYVELINLSDQDIEVSRWTIDGELAGGRQARFPTGSVVKAHSVLVAAVDANDTQDGLAGNGIDARAAWQIAGDVTVVQLEFPSGAPTRDDDWLKVALPSGETTRLILRSALGVIVDEVEYLTPLTTAAFQSLEKGDPTVVDDSDHNNIDDGWYPSLKLYTPGQTNDNEGTNEVVGIETITHDPSEEITIVNRPLAGVGELAGVPSGTAWQPFASADLANIVDRLTVEGHRLEVENHALETGGAWEEQAEGSYLHTDPAKADIAGQWRWTGLGDGSYRLTLYGCDGCLGEQMSVRWQNDDGTMTGWSPSLTADAQGRISIGQVDIGLEGGTPSGSLTLEVRCGSASGICHFDYVRLDPQLIRVGPVNANTAPAEVLRAMSGMTDALASRMIAGRPYGDQDGKGRGIGDLLLGDVLGADEDSKLEAFRQIGHLLTTRSDVFQILSLGQGLNEDQVSATQRIQAVVQR